MPPPPITDEHINYGLFQLHTPPDQLAGPIGPTTIIVTGVGRSGTSMAAHVIETLGLPMGSRGQAVHEDKEFTDALATLNFPLMLALIDSRNAAAERWGFKFPSLQNHLLPLQLHRFRNPRLVVVMRDPVAVAIRANISDPNLSESAVAALANVTRQTADLMEFIKKAGIPTLMLSYEKFLAFPAHAVDAMVDFCGLTVMADARHAARAVIQPNNPDYIRLFHADHRGHLNGVRDNVAIGWCRANASDDPVEIEVLANDKLVALGRADRFRQDLADAAIGIGRHSFQIDLSQLNLADSTILHVRTSTGFVLEGSDQPLVNLRVAE